MTLEAPITPHPGAGALASLAERAREFAGQSQSASTRRAYRADWADFVRWCAGVGQPALPASAVAVASYLAGLAAAGLKASTISRRRAAIRYAHQAAGEEPPTGRLEVAATVAGIRRALGTAPTRKAPALTTDLRAMVGQLPNTLRGVRDRALLLVGFAGAFRRSELVALDLADIEEAPDGIIVTIRQSKTDQEGAGEIVGIPRGEHLDTCPVRALTAWLQAAGIREGLVLAGAPGRGDRARELVRSRFTIGAMANALLPLYAAATESARSVAA